MTFEHKNIDELKGKFEDGDRPIGEDFARLLDSCHNTLQDTSVGITGTLTVSGDTTHKSNVSIASSLSVDGPAAINGSTTLRSTLGVSGPVSLNSTLGVTGAVSIGSTLGVSGVANLHNSLNVAGDTLLSSAVGVIGPTTINNTLDVSGHTNMSSLTSTGHAVFTDTLSVAKEVVLLDTVGITGATTLTSTLNVLGASDLQALKVQGMMSVESMAVFDNNVHIKGNLRVDGNAYLSAGGGVINVGDSNDDNLIFNADVASDVNLDADGTYNLGSADKRWLNIHVTDIDVTGVVDGRDISNDGEKLDSVSSTVDSLSASWSDVYTNVSSSSANRESVYTNVNSSSANRDSVFNTVDSNSARWENVYTDVSSHSGDWNDVYNNVATASASRDSVYVNVNTNSADWNEVYVTTKNNSADWFIDTMEELKDVDVTGAVHNSILKYEANTGKWVVSTVDDDDIRATAQLVVDAITPDGQELILIDNSKSPVPRTVTFTASAGAVSGVYIKTNDTSYVFGTSSLTDTTEIAFVTTSVINKANDDGNISIHASVVGDTISLTQLEGGPGGNTDISGSATGNASDVFLYGTGSTNTHNPAFAGGEAVDNFESLSDTPGSYGSNAGNFVKVNNTETGLEFISHPTGDWNDTYNSVSTTSGTWNDVYNNVASTSANRDNLYTDVSTTSGTWDNVYTNVANTSANRDSVYTDVSQTSGTWNSVYTDVSETSGEWNDVYNNVASASANRDSVYTDVSETSGDWNSVYTDVSQTSAQWNSVYTDVSTTSGTWNDVYTNVASTSANRDSVYTDVSTTSGTWNDVYTNVASTSANRDSVYTDVSTTSGDWDSVYSYIKSASGHGLATVDAQGKLITSLIPELSITRVHATTSPSEVANLSPSTGIQTGDVVVVSSTHDNLIAVVDNPSGVYSSAGDYTGYAKLALPDGLVQTVNGKPGPSVVLNPDDLDDTSTAHKYISTLEKLKLSSVYSSVNSTSASWTGGNSSYNTVHASSADWDSVYSNVSNTSASWTGGNSSYNTVHASSADWDSVYSNVSNTSGEWNSVYTDVSETSAQWNSVYTDVSETSAQWDSVYTFINSDSATNNTGYNQSMFVDSTGDTMTGKLEIQSSELEVGGNITMAGDLIHQDDTGTKISFNTDTITLEANGQEFITIDGTTPTPDTVIINEAATTPVHFIIKTPDHQPALYFRGTDGFLGLGTSAMGVKLTVVGGISASENLEIEQNATIKGNSTLSGDVDVKSTLNGVDINLTGSLTTTGEMVSAGVPLHNIFSTDVDIRNDLTVHGSISAVDSLSANDILSQAGFHTINNIGETVTGISQDINIGGHVLHIVNGLIVGVTDE